MKNPFKSISENQIAFAVIFLLTVVFLFPAFLGFIDTPTDIRNVRMYPWRYYAVDKQIKNITLWQATFPKEQTIID